MKDILRFFREKDKRSILFLIGIIFFGISLEILSLSIISPTVSLVLGQSENFELFQGIIKINSLTSKDVLVLLLVVFVIKFFYFGGLSFYQNKVLANLIEYVSSTLFKKFITEKYSDRKEKTSGDVVNIIQNEVGRFHSYQYHSMILFIEIIFSASIILILLYFNFFVTLYIIITGFLFGVAYKSLFGKRLKYYGEKRQNLEFLTTNKIIESSSLFKEIKVFKKEQQFYIDFKTANEKRFFYNSRYMTLNQFSRYFIEIVFIMILVSSLGLSLFLDLDLYDQIPSISLFMAASIRIIPSMNRIISSYQTRKYFYPSVKIISDNWLDREIELIDENSKISDFKSSILFENISFSHDSKKTLLKNFKIEIHKNQIIGIKGESGVGKSTLFDIILNLFNVDELRFKVDGKEIKRDDLSFNFFGFVPQKIYLLNQNIYQNIAFSADYENLDINLIDDFMSKIGLEEFIGDFNRKLGEGGEKVSGGQKQKIGILRAFYNQSKVLLFDESFSNLDASSKHDVLEFLNKEKRLKSFLIISHDEKILKFCDDIITL